MEDVRDEGVPDRVIRVIGFFAGLATVPLVAMVAGGAAIGAVEITVLLAAAVVVSEILIRIRRRPPGDRLRVRLGVVCEVLAVVMAVASVATYVGEARDAGAPILFPALFVTAFWLWLARTVLHGGRLMSSVRRRLGARRTVK